MQKPEMKPQSFGFKKGDFHLVVNSDNRVIRAFTFEGVQVWQKPCLAIGQNINWQIQNGDTPPGLYTIGEVFNDFAIFGNNPSYSRVLASYGWCSFDLVDLEGNEDRSGRAGIMVHGGGSGLGWDECWKPDQKLSPTLGCIRMHNGDLINSLLPLVQKNTVFVSVYQ